MKVFKKGANLFCPVEKKPRRQRVPVNFPVGSWTLEIIDPHTGKKVGLLKRRTEDSRELLIFVPEGAKKGTGYVIEGGERSERSVVQWLDEDKLNALRGKNGEQTKEALLSDLENKLQDEFSDLIGYESDAVELQKRAPKIHLSTVLPLNEVQPLIQHLKKHGTLRPYSIHRLFYPGEEEKWFPELLRAARHYNILLPEWLIEEFEEHHPIGTEKRRLYAEMLYRRVQTALDAVYLASTRMPKYGSVKHIIQRLEQNIQSLESRSNDKSKLTYKLAVQRLKTILKGLKKVEKADRRTQITQLRVLQRKLRTEVAVLFYAAKKLREHYGL